MWYATYTSSVSVIEISSVKIARRNQEAAVASFRQELEKRGPHGIPSLDDVESGKLIGAVLPMSEKAQIQMRNSIEVIDYLLNQERVVWS
jgi:hypothetical protein